MDYFAGLDISMDETHVCVVDREGEVVHESKTASTAQAIAVELAKARRCRRIVFENRSNGPHLVPRAQPPGSRRARAGASGPHRLLQARACEVPAGPCTPLADHRAQEAGRPAGDLGKPDPRPRGRVRDPAPSRTHRRFRQPGSQSQRRGRGALCRHAGFDRRADCRNDGGRRDHADMRRMTRASSACRRLMTIPGVGQLTALAFVAAIDDPSASVARETSTR